MAFAYKRTLFVDLTMDKLDLPATDKSFFSDPKILEHYSLLQEIGVFKYIDSLDREIRNSRDLLVGAKDIFNRTSIDEIMNATVFQISDHSLPSFIVFVWKPMQNREDITIRSYKNYKPVDMSLAVESISAFEPFFLKYPKPINYDLFSYQFGKSEDTKCFDEIKPELLIPILGPSGLYGMVLMGHKILGEEYSLPELELIGNLMTFVSQAIQNHLHYERTLRDIKTGLYNNGFFLSRLTEEIAKSKRTLSKSSILMIDVDKFKNFNDAYGHLAGDRVLESMAITIKQGVRLGDVPSRFGGEEFAILLPDTDREPAIFVAERIREMVAAMKVPWEPSLPQVTISLGLFTFDGLIDIDADGVISRADEALYLSKELGRNRTTVWGSGLFEKIERMKTGN